jgi:hypothetical protein
MIYYRAVPRSETNVIFLTVDFEGVPYNMRSTYTHGQARFNIKTTTPAGGHPRCEARRF